MFTSPIGINWHRTATKSPKGAGQWGNLCDTDTMTLKRAVWVYQWFLVRPCNVSTLAVWSIMAHNVSMLAPQGIFVSSNLRTVSRQIYNTSIHPLDQSSERESVRRPLLEEPLCLNPHTHSLSVSLFSSFFTIIALSLKLEPTRQNVQYVVVFGCVCKRA